jgi:hypothetical protein
VRLSITGIWKRERKTAEILRPRPIVSGQGILILLDGVGGDFGFHLQPVKFDSELREEVLIGVASALHAGHLSANLADPLIPLLDFHDQPLDRFKTGHNFGSHCVTY